MSIVAMKNKSRGYNHPISGFNYVGFALNGSLRNQGYVGQGSIGRVYIRTPFKGNYPVGHGGYLGRYYVNPIISCSSCSNDPSIVKKSTMNNLGHINSSLLYPTDKGECVVPIVSNTSIEENTAGNYISSQSEYVQVLQKTTAGVSCDTSDVKKVNNCNNNKTCGTYSKQIAPISSGDYMSSIIYKKKCITTGSGSKK